MHWTIDLMYLVLLTTVTGSILFLVWYTVGKILEVTGFINIVFELMKIVLAFWMLPVMYAALQIVNRHYVRWGGYIFQFTPMIERISIPFSIFWFGGFLFFLSRYVAELIMLCRRRRHFIPCDGEEYDQFEEICQKLGVKGGTVDLLWNAGADVPTIEGVFRPAVILPVGEYGRHELDVIFTHELTHYLQRDLWVRHLTALAKCVNFFNLLVWLFERKVELWGEYACDYESIERIGTLKDYFSVIVAIAVDARSGSFLGAGLVEKKSDLDRRMLLMKRSYKMKTKRSKRLAVLVVAAMTMVGSVSVGASTMQAGEVYLQLYNATVEDKEYGVNRGSNTYFVADGLEEGVKETVGEVNSQTKAGYTVEWKIPAGCSTKTRNFTLSAGARVTVMGASDPSSVTLRVGLIYPNGTRCYYTGLGGAHGNYDITTSGTYSYYMQNMSSTTDIKAYGSYFIN